MKLLLDIKAVGLRKADDFVVWEWRRHWFTIVSKDIDFHQRAVVWPPAEVHMATRRKLRDWLDHESSEIALLSYSAIIVSEMESLLVLKRPQIQINLKATLANKRTDRKHQHTNEQGGY